MGVGLVANYRYMFPDRLQELKQNISRQLTEFLPMYASTPIELKIYNHALLIKITIDDSVYKYVIDEQENNQIALKELLDEAEES